MHAGDRAAVRLGSVLSVAVGVWALGTVALPFGVIGGAVAALFGLVFGVLAVRAHAWGGWRKAALVGIAISILAVLVAAAEVCLLRGGGVAPPVRARPAMTPEGHLTSPPCEHGLRGQKRPDHWSGTGGL
jgi:MFS family permease